MANENSDWKITESTTERSLSEIFGESSVVYNIPFFQRQFQWDGHKLNPLWEDLLTLLNESEESHFLGVLIALRRRSDGEFEQINILDVIDGQQRLTTMYLMFLAIAEHYAACDDIKKARDIFEKFLTLRYDEQFNMETNLKLCLSQADRPQLAKVFQRVLKNEKLFHEIREDFRPRYPLPLEEPAGAVNDKLVKMYKLIRDKIRSLEDSDYSVDQLLNVLTKCSRIVVLVTEDPRQGPKIFERWNARGEPISLTDLVRNQIFAMADDPTQLVDVHTKQWMPFVEDFPKDDKGKCLDGYFFPYGLIKNSSISKGRLFAELRSKYWKKKSAKSILRDLSRYKDYYLTLALQENRVDLKKKTFEALGSLLESGVATTTYPFLMQLLEQAQEKSTENEATKILEVVESYWTRRAIARQDAGGLKAVFLTLWPKVKNDLNASNVANQLRGQNNEKWPTDEEVIEAVRIEGLYTSKIIRFLLTNLELNFYGASKMHPRSEWHVEHILPQNPDVKSEWWKLFSPEKHRERRNTLANLIPLYGPENIELSNKGYVKVKRDKYIEQNFFTSPTEVAKKHEVWNPKALDMRATELANWIVNRWPRDKY